MSVENGSRFGYLRGNGKATGSEPFAPRRRFETPTQSQLQRALKLQQRNGVIPQSNEDPKMRKLKEDLERRRQK